MKAWTGALVDSVAIVAATALLVRGLIPHVTWGAVVIPIVAHWISVRRGGPPGAGGTGAATGATLGVLFGLGAGLYGILSRGHNPS